MGKEKEEEGKKKKRAEQIQEEMVGKKDGRTQDGPEPFTLKWGEESISMIHERTGIPFFLLFLYPSQPPHGPYPEVWNK